MDFCPVLRQGGWPDKQTGVERCSPVLSPLEPCECCCIETVLYSGFLCCSLGTVSLVTSAGSSLHTTGCEQQGAGRVSCRILTPAEPVRAAQGSK